MNRAPFPKIDLHRHLEGAIRPETFLDIAKSRGIALPAYELEELRPYLQVLNDAPDFLNFLDKFKWYRGFWPDREAIERVAYEAVEDAARDSVVYLELRYSPVHYAAGRGFAAGDIVDWITSSARKAAAQYNIRVEFIACIGRHFSLETNLPSFQLAREGAGDTFVAIDVAGDEINYPLDPFADEIEKARNAGLGLTLHAGETGSWHNVREAIVHFQADRIGHGVAVASNAATIELARQRGTAFEMCLTSNVQTAAVPSFAEHPAHRLFVQGLAITLNTDDPAISRIDLSHEYEVAVREGGFNRSDVPALLHHGVQAAFIDEKGKAELFSRLGLG